MTHRLRLLRGVSILIFAFALMNFLFTNLATYASRVIEVRDKVGDIIGTTSIPYDYAANSFSSLTFLILSGLQLWGVLELARVSKRST